jgi:hypothetical protein
MPSTEPFTARQYLLEDYRHTLFPLSTTKLLVEKFAPELYQYWVSNPFRPQTRCSAAKRGFHLRRTVKLDPPSELFVYALVFRNRKQFRVDHNQARSSFGFLFQDGRPISSKAAYQDYRREVSFARSQYRYGIRFDVSSYFNSLYHHDLVSRFREIGASEEDVTLYGRFLREINSGRSLDCLPHGLHPCKVFCNGPRYFGRSGQIVTRRFCDGLSPLTRLSWNGPRRQGFASPRQTTARP